MYLPKKVLNLDITGVLGSGSFGTIAAASDSITGTRVALKFVKKTQAPEAMEPHIQALLEHRGICRLYGCLENAADLILVLECVRGVDLSRYLRIHGKLEEHRARMLFIQMLHAVDYLHAHSIVHRDLKLDNVILDAEHIKICDFGFATFYSDAQLLEDYCGTPQYAPPEIVNGVPYIGPEVDMWCLGIILYAMVHGCLPFDQDSTDASTHVMQSRVEVDEHLSPTLVDLIRRLLDPNRATRMRLDQAAAHPWTNTARKRHRRDVVFIDNAVVDLLCTLGIRRKDVLNNLSSSSSRECAMYALVREKMMRGYNAHTFCIIPQHSCDLIDLAFVDSLESCAAHYRSRERHRMLESIASTRTGCLSLCWHGQLYMRRSINADLHSARATLEKSLLGLSKAFSYRASVYTVFHSNSLQITVELAASSASTTCTFTLVKGDRLDFAQFLTDIVRGPDQASD